MTMTQRPLDLPEELPWSWTPDGRELRVCGRRIAKEARPDPPVFRTEHMLRWVRQLLAAAKDGKSSALIYLGQITRESGDYDTQMAAWMERWGNGQ